MSCWGLIFEAELLRKRSDSLPTEPQRQKSKPNYYGVYKYTFEMKGGNECMLVIDENLPGLGKKLKSEN
jgi:hypothetical protein